MDTTEDNLILVLSKDEKFIEAFSQSVESLYRVVITTDIKSARNIIETEKPVLGILDVSACEDVSYTDCREFISELNKRYIAVYLLILAGQEDNEIIKGLSSIADVVMVKPVELSYLVDKVKSSINCRKLEREVIEQEKILNLLNAEADFEKNDLNKSEIRQAAMGLLKQYKEFAQRTIIRERQKTETLRISQENLKETNQKLKETIEELKNTQAQLMRSEKLASIGRLAGGVAHEINTPLGVISINTQILLAEIHDKSHRELLEIIRRTTLKVKEIIEHLLKYAGSDRGSFGRVDINEVITMAVTSLKDKFFDSGIAVIGEYAESVVVKGNRNELAQVFMNILLNAQEAVIKTKGKDHQGEIKIKTYAQDDYVVVEFNDNGCGIKEENLSRVFDPFFTTKEVGAGMGLGLSVCLRIIEQHRGKIELESYSGQGAKVKVSLPR